MRRLFTDSEYKPKPWHIVINWGNSNGLEHLSATSVSRIVNPVHAVKLAGNKLSTFQALKDKDGINIPEFTVDQDVARGWIRDGACCVCRTTLSGHSGRGIVLSNTEDELVAAPLYVKYIKKQDEYRVHVAFGEVIDVQQKRKRAGFEGRNAQIRNHQTGWVYCREDITEPDGLRELAVATTAALGLDFGAVDIIYNAKQNKCYCLEVNTAPGLEGTTVVKYTQAFRNQFGNENQSRTAVV